MPEKGRFVEIFNSDNSSFYGSNVLNTEPIQTIDGEWQGREQHIVLNLPPLAAVFLKKM
jgi:1,4-alpha-glucan branching enzyme